MVFGYLNRNYEEQPVGEDGAELADFIADGGVVEGNFDGYPLLRIDEAPKIEIHFVPSTEPPTGLGEMVFPTIMPAVANAVSAATGKRVRRLPIRPEDVRRG